MTSVADRLRALGAHNDVVQWSAPFGDDALSLVERCPRGDWLLGIAARLGAERGPLVRAAAGCAREAMTYLPDARPPLTAALEVLEKWFQGQATADECGRHALRAESLSSHGDSVADTVAEAVAAALSAVNEPSTAAHAAASAVHAAVLAAGDCAMEPALRFTQERCANIVRRELGVSTLAALLQRAG